jgi:hypothetical protein
MTNKNYTDRLTNLDDLKQALSRENINTYDNNKIRLTDIKNVLAFTQDSLINQEIQDQGAIPFKYDSIASIIKLVDKEITYLQDELERHYNDTKRLTLKQSL